jgi:hypothetical protein
MSECFITVAAMRPEEWDVNHEHLRRVAVLAFWRAPAAGDRWLDQLVGAGKALQLKHGGFPSRWTALAVDVLPMLIPLTHLSAMEPLRVHPTERELPGYKYAYMIDAKDFNLAVITGKFIWDVQLNCELIARCPPVQILTIDVWDAS